MSFIVSLISTPFGALAAMLAVMVIGETIAKLTKGFVPMALTATILLLAAFWSGLFPANISDLAGMGGTIFQIGSAILVVNLGTLINRKEMIAQWKTVIICLMGLASIIAVCLILGATIFTMSDAFAAAPPLTGGAIASAMVRQVAGEHGNNAAVMLAIVCMSGQSLFGYPMVAFCLQKEAKELVKDYRAGKIKAPSAAAADSTKKASKKESTNMIRLKLCLAAVISYLLQLLTAKMGFQISMFVWCLLVGFLFHEMGWLGDNCLQEANAYGFAITILMVYLLGGLSSNDPSIILPTFGKAATFVIACAIGMAGIEGLQKIQQIMATLREDAPKEIAGYKVLKVRDYKKDEVVNLETGEKGSTGLPNSNVLYYELPDDAWLCVRPSGTEPKIKFYYGIVGSSLEDADQKSDAFGKAVLAMIDEMTK